MTQTAQEQQVHKLPEFHEGMRIEVLTMSNRLIFVGIIQKNKKGVLHIVEESGNELPYIEYNSTVKLRGFSNGEAFTVAGMIGGNTRSIWKLDRLRALQAKERREYFRQNTSIDAQLICANEIFSQRTVGVGRAKPMTCKIVDISAGGLCVRCEGQFEKGDWLLITGVELQPKEPPFSFTCQVMRVMGEGRTRDYGCAFFDLDVKEQERLIRLILILQRKELQARRSQRYEL